MEKLNERLNHLTTPDFYPLLILSDQSIPPQVPKDSQALPPSIKDKDVEYQFHRVVIFRRLLEGKLNNYRVKYDRIIQNLKQAKIVYWTMDINF